MSLLGIDTCTAASAACVLLDDGEAFEVAPEPAALMARPAHARELMPAVATVLERAGVGYAELDAVAVGVGPGTFTGLRIGVATARALASANGLEVRPVSSLAALAAGIEAEVSGRAAAGAAAGAAPADADTAADPPAWLLPVLDAKRGEVFAAGYAPGGRRLWGPLALRPEALAERVAADAEERAGAGAVAPLAAGDGSLRFRRVLEAAGISVMPDESRSHVVRALYVCRLAATVPGVAPQAVLPDYLRAPDAKPQ